MGDAMSIEEKKKKKKKKSAPPSMLWLWLTLSGVGVVLVGVGIGVAVWLNNRGASQPDPQQKEKQAANKKGYTGKPRKDAPEPPAKDDPFNKNPTLTQHLAQHDPGGRLKDILAKRNAVPIEQNGADLVNEIHGSIPKSLIQEVINLTKDEHVAPNLRRDPAASARLRKQLQDSQAIVTKARKFATIKDGRFEIVVAVNPIDTKVQHLERVRDVADVLQAMVI